MSSWLSLLAPATAISRSSDGQQISNQPARLYEEPNPSSRDLRDFALIRTLIRSASRVTHASTCLCSPASSVPAR
eukprot:2374837-Pleurochrysis_carterae.AAC.1